MRTWTLGASTLCVLIAAGCASILGIEEQTYDGQVAIGGTGGAGGDSSASGATATASGPSTGAGGASTSSGTGGAGGTPSSTASGSSSTSTATASSSSGGPIDDGTCAKACDLPEFGGGPCERGHCPSEWAQWAVPNFVTGLPNPASYEVRADVVVDEVTYLMWQLSVLDTDTKYTWSEAKDHCRSLTLDGHEDWRLPNAVELQSIVKPTYTTSPTIDISAFPKTPTSFFATSSPVANSDTKAWRVSFGDGSMTQYSRTVPAFVRCVRGPIY